MKKLLIIAILISTHYSLSAQNGKILGKVIDAAGEAYEFVNLLLLDAKDSTLVKGAVSNPDGGFEFERVQPGNYVVAAKFVGFNDSYSDVISSNNDKKVIDKIILSEGVELGEVMITAQKPFIEMQADKVVVNVENSSVNAGNSALEVLQKSPGVTVDQDNNIILRGKQGVLVMINGKNQYMSGEEITRLLESMPAENIKNIEIINNPSAKYDAQGNSGIINIRLKKNENLGANGSVNAGVRQGVKFTYNVGGNLNYRSNKLNVYGNMSFYDWSNFQELDLLRVIPFGSGNTTFDQESYMDRRGLSLNGKVGVDYFLNDKTTVGVLAKVNTGETGMLANINTNIFGINAPNFNLLGVNSLSDNTWNQQSYNFNVLHNFNDQGNSISFDMDYSRYSFDGFNSYDNRYFNLNDEEVLPAYLLRNDQMTAIDIYAAQLDYTKNIAEGFKLETGAKISMVRTNNDTQFDALEEDEWVIQDNMTNNFIYTENVAAAYLNLAKSFGKVNIQGGLRMEHTQSEGNSITLDQVVPREYTNFFPSISISHPLGEKHNLSYTYSRRLNRPNYQNLNPFVNFLDQYTFEKGNPFLNPQFSDAFGVNYSYGGFLFVSANYSFTNDAITQVIEQFSEENTTFQTYQNLEDFNSGDLTISAPIPWKQFGTTRISLTGFYNDFQSSIPSGTLNNQSFGYNIYVGNEFRLPKSIGLELTGSYRSGLTYGLFEITPMYGIDLGFTKRFLNDNAILKVGIDDIFWTRNQEVRVMQDDINLNVDQLHDTRRVKVNLTYNFGNKKVKSARRRSTATESETSRINTN